MRFCAEKTFSLQIVNKQLNKMNRMKKVLPLLAVALLLACNSLFGQTSTDAPAKPTDKHAAHLQNKLLKRENKNAAYVQFESSLFTGRMNVLSLQTGSPYGQIPSFLGTDAASAYMATEQELQNVDLSNPAGIMSCYSVMICFQQAFLKQNIPADSEFIPLCTAGDLAAMLQVLGSIKDSSDFTAIITAFSKINLKDANAQAIAQLCIFDYVEAYVAAQASAQPSAGVHQNGEMQFLNALLPTTGAALDLLSWQAQVIQYENTLPAPTQSRVPSYFNPVSAQ